MLHETDITVVILVPAHNEEEGISDSLDQLIGQLTVNDRILLVADNCSDKTAAIGLQKKVVVIQRHDKQKQGKGYALDYGIQFLANNPPDVVVIMDADVSISSGTIQILSQLAYRYDKPVQAKYILKASDSSDHKTAISTFAFLLKNYIRPLGLSQMGGGCLLMGTGMAFPWDVIKRAQLATDNIVEDMQLGIELAINGYSPMYCQDQDVVVYSDAAPSTKVARTQRVRWEHGHISTLLSQCRKLFFEACRQRRLNLFLLGLEVAVPPLALFVLLLGCGGTMSVLCYYIEQVPAIVMVGFMFLIVLFVLGISIGWYCFGRAFLSFKQIMTIPIYIIWKIPIYCGFLINPQKQWIRTERNKKNSENGENL